MEQQDLQQIKEVVKEEVNELALITKKGFEAVDKRFEAVDKRFENLEGKVANLPSKEYVGDKIADAIVEIFNRLDRKGVKEKEFKSRIIGIIKRNNLASKEDIAYLEGLVQS